VRYEVYHQAGLVNSHTCLEEQKSECGFAFPIFVAGAALSILVLVLLNVTGLKDETAYAVLSPGFFIVHPGHADVLGPFVALGLNASVYAAIVYGFVRLWRRMKR
jgi:hypothetical protein